MYSEFKSLKSKPRAAGSLLVQTNAHIHCIEWSDLNTILNKFPVFRDDFLSRMMFSYQIGVNMKVSVDFKLVKVNKTHRPQNIHLIFLSVEKL